MFLLLVTDVLCMYLTWYVLYRHHQQLHTQHKHHQSTLKPWHLVIPWCSYNNAHFQFKIKMKTCSVKLIDISREIFTFTESIRI